MKRFTIIGVMAVLSCKPVDAAPGAPETAKPAPSAPSLASAIWHVSNSTDPVTDKATVSASLTSVDGMGLSTAVMVLRCDARENDAYVIWDDYLGNDGQKVVWRLDSLPAVTEWWNISRDGKAVFYQGNVRKWLRQIGEASRLLVRVTPYGESDQTASFDLSDLDRAVRELGLGCGWAQSDSIAEVKAAGLRAKESAAREAWNKAIDKIHWIGESTTMLVYPTYPTCMEIIAKVPEEERVEFKTFEAAQKAGYRLTQYAGCDKAPARR